MYLFFDIDGTLIDSNHGFHEPSTETLNALRKAKENGHHIFIASGRNLAGIAPYMKFEDVEMEGAVFCDGAGILYHGEVIETSPIEQNAVENLVKRVLELDGGISLFSMHTAYPSEKIMKNLQDVILSMKGNDTLEEVMEKMGMKRLEEYDNDPILGVDIAFPDEETEQKFISDLDPALTYLTTTESANSIDGTYGEATAHGVSKGEGIRKFAQLMHIDISETMAFGDSMNDYEMLKKAGTGTAMGNAPDSVKEAADYVTDTIRNEGLSKALKHFNLI